MRFNGPSRDVAFTGELIMWSVWCIVWEFCLLALFAYVMDSRENLKNSLHSSNKQNVG